MVFLRVFGINSVSHVCRGTVDQFHIDKADANCVFHALG
jgi:hypothetical protein